MNNKITSKVLALSILYVVLLFPLAAGLNLGMEWLLNNVIFKLLNWFNHLSFFWQLILFFFEGFILIMIIMSFARIVGSFLSYYIFLKLPDNLFTIIVSTALYLFNVGLSIYWLWQSIPNFTFLITIEFLLLVYLIFALNTIIMPWYTKSKMRKKESNFDY